MWLINAETLELEQHDPPDVDAVQALATSLDDDFWKSSFASGIVAEPASQDSDQDASRSVPTDLQQGCQDSNLPGVRYSILSHRWHDGEVSMREFRDPVARARKPGFRKIRKCCEESLFNGIKYVWIDTCCIDKDNLAELSESINSMYIWYQAAAVCYVYIADCDGTSDLEGSEWFSRGWPLQELIAPRDLRIYNKSWQCIGTRSALSASIAAVTGIPQQLLQGVGQPSHYSVAQRMSWASKRMTTRPEDQAYCLIGLFGVNMPLLYGEGRSRAFRRLQEEIVKSTYDHSIFAWTRSDNSRDHGMLATSPSAFGSCSGTQILPAMVSALRSYAVTNGSLAMTLQTAPWYPDTHLALLECLALDDTCHVLSQVGIFISRLSGDTDRWARVSVNGRSLLIGAALDEVINGAGNGRKLSFDYNVINVQQGELPLSERDRLNTRKGYGFRLAADFMQHKVKIDPKCKDVRQGEGLVLYKDPGFAKCDHFGTLRLMGEQSKIKLIKLYLESDLSPVVFMAEEDAINSCSRTDLPRFEPERLNYEGHSDAMRAHSSYSRAVNDAAAARLLAFSSRSNKDCFGWNVVKEIDGTQTALGNILRPGLWMLRGLRGEGFKVVLQGLAEDPANPAVLTVMQDKDVKDGHLQYWVVKLENVPGFGGS